MKEPALTIDFKPQLTAELLRERAMQGGDWFRIWKLHPAAIALLETAGEPLDLEQAIGRVKNFALRCAVRGRSRKRSRRPAAFPG